MAIIKADARSIPLQDRTVQCVITSPPYWGLRNYGVDRQIGLERNPDCLGWATQAPCGECYVCTMVAVFREVRRVLKDDGVVWLNLGDSYAGSMKGYSPSGYGYAGPKQRTNRGSMNLPPTKDIPGLKPKDLCMMPARVALALQSDGWYLRSDIIWAKPSPMPESVKDRPTHSHEYIFLFAKHERYYYNADAIKEVAVEGADLGLLRGRHTDLNNRIRAHTPSIAKRQASGVDPRTAGTGYRNKRDVWIVATESTPEAHFATFPQKLVEPCILAGSRPGDLVLDPFLGSGTVGRVAERFGRRWIGLELADEYIAIARRRTAQTGLRLIG